MILFLKRINILLALILLSLALGIVKFKNNLPNQKISNFDVDAIVVLTGGKGERIIEGYNQIENSNQKKLFISGVDNTFNSEVVLVNILNFDREVVNCCIEVGYLSKNTYENALETRYWALEKKIQSILLITSNLHMQRAEFLFNQLSGLEVIPFAVRNEELIIPFEKMLEEYVKLLISKIVFVKKYEILFFNFILFNHCNSFNYFFIRTAFQI